MVLNCYASENILEKFAKHHLIKLIINRYEPIDQVNLEPDFYLIERVLNTPDSLIKFDSLYYKDDIKVILVKDPIKHEFFYYEPIIAVIEKDYDYESVHLTRDNILEFINSYITINDSAYFFSAIDLLNSLIIEKNAIILTKSNTQEFSYLLNNYQIKLQELDRAYSDFYYYLYYKVVDEDIINYYEIIYFYEDNKMGYEKHLLFRITNKDEG